MKKKPLKGIVILIALLLMQTACRQSDKEKLAKAVEYEQKGAVYQTENNWDSAIANYYKSYEWYSLLDVCGQPMHQAKYVSKAAQLAYKLACCYEMTHNFDDAAIYAEFSFNYCEKLKQTDSCTADEILIGYYEYKAAQTKINESNVQMSFYKHGAEFIYPACRAVDSLGWDKSDNEKRRKMALLCYMAAESLFYHTGDSANEQLYHQKYNDLYFKLTGHLPEN